jgi:hypothetical protein
MTNHAKHNHRTVFGSAGEFSLSGMIQPLHLIRQKSLLVALMATPSEYLTEEWQGKPLIVKRMKPQIQSANESDIGKSMLIKHMFDNTIISAGIVLPQTEDIVRLFNISKHRIYDNEGPEAFIYEPAQDGKWQEVRHDNEAFLSRERAFTNVQAYKDGTYSIDTDNARVQICWNGITVSRLNSRLDWQDAFCRSTLFTDKFDDKDLLTAVKNLRSGTKLLTVEYDRTTARPKQIKYSNSDKWITEDGGATWTITRDGKKSILPQAWVSIDRNGNLSYLVRERRSREDEGLLVCYIDTPCGRRIRAPRRIDTDALMRSDK